MRPAELEDFLVSSTLYHSETMSVTQRRQQSEVFTVYRSDTDIDTGNLCLGVCLLGHACAERGDTAIGGCAMGFGVCGVSIIAQSNRIVDKKSSLPQK